MKKEFKVGDKVKIRKGLKVNEVYDSLNGKSGVFFTLNMNKYAGKKTEIIEIFPSCFKLKIDDGYWAWSPKMIKPVKKLKGGHK